MAIATGTKLGRYEIRSKIGEGGMGEVYLARDIQLERDIALKILTADVARDQQRLHRFLQEARAASALSHPNVAHITKSEKSKARTSSRWNTSKVRASIKRSRAGRCVWLRWSSSLFRLPTRWMKRM